MGRNKRRQTAKTGDKAIYKNRGITESQPKSSKNKDDSMYNEIDQYHKEREDFIRLDNAGAESSDEDDGITNQQAVLDLGGGESSSDDDDDDADDDESDIDMLPPAKMERKKDVDSDVDEEESSFASSDDDDDDDNDNNVLKQLEKLGTNTTNWGKRKSQYYHGDVNDIEIGQEEEDAYLEEEAAQEIQAARFQTMQEDDFMLSDDDDDDDNDKSDQSKKDKQKDLSSTATTTITSSRDLSKLSKKQKRKLLSTQHSELLPIVSYFTDIVQNLQTKTNTITQALFFNKDEQDDPCEAIGTNEAGKKYLITKALLESSIALNVCTYLLLKSEQSSSTEAIKAHPVMDMLQNLNNLVQKLQDNVESKGNLEEQTENLVQAIQLMQSEQGLAQDDDKSSEDDESVPEQKTESQTCDNIDESDDDETSNNNNATKKDDMEDDSENDVANKSMLQPVSKLDVMKEAKFGLRAHEIKAATTTSASSSKKKKKKRKIAYEFGEEDDNNDNTMSRQSLAATMNSIQQRSGMNNNDNNRRAAPSVEQLDYNDDDEIDDQLKEGLRMMEEQLGKLDSDEDQGPMDIGGGDVDDDDSMGHGENEIYEKMLQKNKTRKALKKSLHQVAPKFPRMDLEVDGERAISKQILKNRGLVAHKAKINRNPRVKKREQYRKALIRRKGAIREVRTNEGHVYGGEATGIKSRLSRSRKL